MRLLPYLSWICYRDLRTIFWKYIPDHHSDGPLRSILHTLHRDGLIEKTYRGTPPATWKNPNNMKMTLSKYLYVRRISKTCPRNHMTPKMLDGTIGIDAEKARQRLALNPPKPPKKSVKTLSIDDYNYIKSNIHSMSEPVLAQMFNQHESRIQLIRSGHVPEHIKAILSRSRP